MNTGSSTKEHLGGSPARGLAAYGQRVLVEPGEDGLPASKPERHTSVETLRAQSTAPYPADGDQYAPPKTKSENPQKPPFPTAEINEQALRDPTYFCSEGEDESDYTGGPSRLVSAPDGVKSECGALLPTLDLSNKI